MDVTQRVTASGAQAEAAMTGAWSAGVGGGLVHGRLWRVVRRGRVVRGGGSGGPCPAAAAACHGPRAAAGGGGRRAATGAAMASLAPPPPPNSTPWRVRTRRRGREALPPARQPRRRLAALAVGKGLARLPPGGNLPAGRGRWQSVRRRPRQGIRLPLPRAGARPRQEVRRS